MRIGYCEVCTVVIECCGECAWLRESLDILLNIRVGKGRFPGGAHTHSIIMRSKTGTVRVIEAEHNFNRKTWGDPVAG